MQPFRKLHQHQQLNTSKHTSFGNTFSLLNKSIVTQLKLIHQWKSQGFQYMYKMCNVWFLQWYHLIELKD